MDYTVCNAELKVPGDLIYLRPVRAFIKELSESIGFHEEKVNNIKLAVDEVFSNAVEHGSANSRSQIVITCSANDEMLTVTISDAGHGKSSSGKLRHAWSNVVTKKTRPGTERGHGLLLAHNLTDEMSMESNSMGGVDVHLVVYKGGQKLANE